MDTTAARARSYRGPALFSYGFRPFFLFAAIWAALVVPIWTLSYLGLLPPNLATRDWHVHEMLFGYLAAAVSGFLLTAVPNWTGRLPVAGAQLIGLFALWLLGRAAMLFEATLGPLAGVLDSLFLIALAAVIWREVLTGRNVRNLPVCVLVSLLALANICFHLRASTAAAPWVGERLALAVAALLIALIGGRIAPSFTRNWMAKRLTGALPAAPDRFDMISLAAAGVALVAWLMAPSNALSGALLLAASLLHFIRLTRWRGWRARAERLVLILHAAYLWLPIAFFLLGLSALTPTVAPTAGVHALAAGAIGTMTLAVMTRATRGHTGRELTAPWGTQMIYVLVTFGAIARVAAALNPDMMTPLLLISSCLWSAAFAGFAIIYGPMLARARAK